MKLSIAEVVEEFAEKFWSVCQGEITLLILLRKLAVICLGLGCDSLIFLKQKCCYCCLLGKTAQVQGQSCEPNLKIGYQCGIVFRACCVKGQEGTDVSISDDAPKKEQGILCCKL